MNVSDIRMPDVSPSLWLTYTLIDHVVVDRHDNNIQPSRHIPMYARGIVTIDTVLGTVVLGFVE
jgi:hypothetical protein